MAWDCAIASCEDYASAAALLWARPENTRPQEPPELLDYCGYASRTELWLQAGKYAAAVMRGISRCGPHAAEEIRQPAVGPVLPAWHVAGSGEARSLV